MKFVTDVLASFGLRMKELGEGCVVVLAKRFKQIIEEGVEGDFLLHQVHIRAAREQLTAGREGRGGHRFGLGLRRYFGPEMTARKSKQPAEELPGQFT